MDIVLTKIYHEEKLSVFFKNKMLYLDSLDPRLLILKLDGCHIPIFTETGDSRVN